MNILVYIPAINKLSGGVLQYSKCLLNILSQDKTNKYFVFLRNNYSEFSEYNNIDNFIILPAKITNYRTSLFSFLELFKFNLISLLDKIGITTPLKQPAALEKIIKKYKIHILHCPFQEAPKVTIPIISTLHDIQEFHFPEYFTPEQRINRAIANKKITDTAANIFVSYQHIKDDIIKYYDSFSEKNINVILLNMQYLWFDKFTNNAQFRLLQLEDLPQDFILYPAATWKHKNHTNLLSAIHFLKTSKNRSINLICTGNKTNYFKEIEKLIIDLDLQNNVFFIGEVSEEKLYTLYKKCKAVVIPSLYEAGSFPLMESILLNIPCICSNVTSLPETINNDSCVFNPLDIENIADKIIKITSDDDFRNECIDKYKISSKKLINTNSLEKIIYIYNSIYQNKARLN